MQPSHLSKLVVTDTGLDAVVGLYIAWVLGLHEFSAARASRLNVGVPKRLTVAALAASGRHANSSKCTLHTQVSDGQTWQLHWVHRQLDDHRLQWHNRVLLAQDGQGVRLAHRVDRDLPPGQPVQWAAGPPQIITRLLEHYGPRLRPTGLLLGAREVLAAGVSPFVEEVLLDEARETPIVLVSERDETGAPWVDPGNLAAALAGMASVVMLRGPAASSLDGALEQAGMGPALGCRNGAVRLLFPSLTRASSPAEHPLLSSEWLSGADGSASWVGGRLIQLMAERGPWDITDAHG